VETVSADRVEDVYRRTHQRLWHALFAYAGDADIAGDAVAEAFAQVLRRGDEVRDVEAWVWRCAFRVIDGLLRDRHLTLPASRDREPIAGADHSSVTEFLSQLGGLSSQQRAVVVLRYVGGFRAAEIADLLRTSPGSVRVQLHRAHAHLRVALEDSDG